MTREQRNNGVLSDQEVYDLIRRARDGDRAARDRLVEANLRLVRSIANRFASSGYDLEDLFQVGCIGLLLAVKRFDPTYGVRFSTYAVPLVMGEIRRHLRDDGPMRVSRSLKTLAQSARKVREQLAGQLRRDPALEEVAAALGAAPEEVVAALESVRAPTSFYQTVHEGSGEPIYLLDQIAASGDRAGLAIDRVMLRECLERLDPRLRRIIMLRYFRDKTQAETAEVLGISQVQVSRLERRALDEIRRFVTAS